MNDSILILGGGPAGMACAIELQKKGKEAIIIEKNKQVGGLAKTIIFTEGKYIFRTDIGPHRFLSQNPYLYDLIGNVLKEKWFKVKRHTRQYIQGKYYDYPINPIQAISNLGFFRAVEMGLSFIEAFVTFRIFNRKIRHVEDYLVAHFGRKLAAFGMLNYTEKIWGIRSSKIHPTWAKQRIKGLSIHSIIRHLLRRGTKIHTPHTLSDEFYYPQYGTGYIYENIAKQIVQGGSEIKTNSYPTKIIHKNYTVTDVELLMKGEEKMIHPAFVVSSIPMTELIKLLSPQPPKKVVQAANNLKWRSQVYLFITLNQPEVTNDQWIYFPEKQIPFGRISEMKNFSLDMSPRTKTSLFVEFFVTEYDAIWNMEKKNLFDFTIKYLEKLNIISIKNVRNYYVFKKRCVYPVYDLDYLQHVRVIKKYLDLFTNLIYIGRPGRFQYTNQDQSMEMGISAANNILSIIKKDEVHI